MGKALGVKAIGCDIVDVARMQQIITRYEKDELEYLFTPAEYQACNIPDYASVLFSVCFAGKEAVGKAVGRGLANMPWINIEVIPSLDGTAKIRLLDTAHSQLQENNCSTCYLSWKYFSNHVIAILDMY